MENYKHEKIVLYLFKFYIKSNNYIFFIYKDFFFLSVKKKMNIEKLNIILFKFEIKRVK